MEFTICPSPSPSSIITCFPAEEAREVCRSAASALITKLFYATFIFIFAVVGATLGVVSGGFVGAKTKMGFIHGAAVGAIKGSFLSIKFFKISLIICSSNDFAFASRYVLQPVLWNEGLSKDSIENIPKMRIAEGNLWDSFRNRSPCSICLEDFSQWETVHRWPECHHIFHISCLQKWLVGHKSCPLCRRNF